VVKGKNSLYTILPFLLKNTKILQINTVLINMFLSYY
jgi:hypothetical protein